MANWLGKIFARQAGGGPPPAGFFAALGGSSANPGTIGSPWTLSYALSGAGGSVTAGDTIWVRGGTYAAPFSSSISGTSGAPICFKAYPGEQPQLDCGGQQDSGYALTINGDYVQIWGFEATNSDTASRWSDDVGSHPLCPPVTGVDCGRNAAFKAMGNGVKFINCIAHDCAEGFTAESAAGDVEIYGCLDYYNGWNATDRGHGHGIYTQNFSGTSKVIQRCFILEPAFPDGCNNIQAYGTDAAAFNDSTITETVWTRALTLMGGAAGFPVLNDTFTNNMSWSCPTGLYHSLDYTGTNITGNYLANVDASTVFAISSNYGQAGYESPAITGNTFIGDQDNVDTPTYYPSNTYVAKGSPPSTTVYYVLGNAYEPNRANVVIYNWANTSTVAVDLSSAVSNGTPINIYNAQDFFGTPVYTGTYNGGTVSIPMTSLTAAAGIGFTELGPTTPAFGTFIVREQGA